MPRRRAVSALSLIALVAFAGCSDSKKDDDAASPAGVSTTVRPVDTSFTGTGSAEFCQSIATFTNESQSITGVSPAESLRLNFEQALVAIDKAAAISPAEIKGDVDITADTLHRLSAAVEAVGFDVSRLDQAALGLLQSEQFLDSASRLQAYFTTICHAGG